MNYGQEVVDLHRFFQDWFLGKLPNTPEAANRYASVTAPGFHIVTVDGRILSRDECLEITKNKYQSRNATFRMWIKNVVLQHQHGDLLLVTYEEWWEDDGKTEMLTSTALFQKADSAPNGLLWLHIHESGHTEVK